MKKTVIWLLATISALLASAATYNGVTYSTSGDIVPGEWTSQFSKAKAYADAKNVPLIVVWANPGCGFCGMFETEAMYTPRMRNWMKTKKYVFVFALGTSTSDGSAAKSFAKYGSNYPYCRVYWKRNNSGKTVSYAFCGRWGMMYGDSLNTKDAMDVQFKNAIEAYVGGYAPSNGGGTVTPVGPVTPVKYTLTVTATGNGSVSGGGSYKSGTKVTLRASAKSGSVFAGWYSGATLLSQATSYSYVTTAGNVSIVGKFITKAEDEVALTCPFASQYTKGVAIEAVKITARGNSLPTVKVSGLPTGLSYKNGEVTGKPSRSGVYTTTVTARTSGGATATKTFTIVVSAFGEYYVKAPCDSTVGTVSGQGVYAAGKKVTLRVTVKKGNVFTGWYNGSTELSREKAYSFTMPSHDISLTPEFITAAEDLAAVSFVFDDYSMSSETVLEKSATCGVKLSWDIISGGLSTTKVTFSGLPSGLKYNASAGKVEGAPTSARKSTIKAKVTTSGGNSKVFSIVLNVNALPTAAKGNFYGLCEFNGTPGRAQIAITAAGKISGKLIAAGSTYSFSATSFDSCEKGVFAFSPSISYAVTENRKTVKKTKNLKLALAPEGDLGRITGGDSKGLELSLLQSAWERTDLKVPKFASGSRTPIVTLANGIKLKFSTKGAVAVGGKIGKTSVSGNSQLVTGCSGGTLSHDAQTALSINRSASAGGYYGALVDLYIDDRDRDGKIETVTAD